MVETRMINGTLCVSVCVQGNSNQLSYYFWKRKLNGSYLSMVVMTLELEHEDYAIEA